MAAPSLPTLVVGGVPEHFNSPVVLGIRNGTFAKHGINVEWKEVPEGTGKMCSMLRDGSLDVALILTEGIVRDIVQGSQAKIVATFIETPLTWAVCASPSTADSVKSIDDLRGKTVGISRYGSGSHLMACVLADDKQWSVERGDFKFDTFDNFVGLRKAVNSGAATAFLWDTFMTKPYCDSGELRKIGEVITPWPCFMVAANADVLSSRWSAVPPLLAALQESAHAFITGGAESLAHLQKNFRLTHDDAVKWMGYTKYSVKGEISRKVLIKTVDVLVRAKMLPPYESKFSFFRFYDSRASIATVDSEEIRTMKLYYDTRVRNELQARGKLQGPLTVEDLVGFDQLHYHGTEAVDYAARTLGFKAGEHVLDVGAGVGGPARYMAAKHGVRVTALEIEPSRVRVADELVERCGLSSLVHVVCADATKYHAPAHVDHIVSWLAILHIRDRLALFRRLLACLRPGGNLLIEDFVQLAPFSASELSALHVAIACPLCPTKDEYVSHLTHAGFVDVHTEDISADWRAFVLARVQNFEATRAQITATHGEEIANGLGYFFGVIADLFASGHLGGIRVVAKRAA